MIKLLRAAAALATALCISAPSWAAQAYVSLGGPGGSVSVFKPTGGAAQQSYGTPKGASDLLLGADGNTLYVGTTTLRVADIGGGSPALVAALDPLSGAPIAQFPMPHSVFKMVADGTGDHLYASGNATATGAAQVMSLDLHTGATASAPVPGAQPFDVYPIGLSPDGGTLYVPVQDSIAVFNAHTLALLGSIALAGNGIVAPPFVTPDGATLLAVGQGKLYVIDTATRTLKQTVSVPASAACFGTALSPDGKTLYVSAGVLSAIDVATLAFKGTASLGQTNPYRLGLSADGSTLYATDLTYATTAVVDTATMTQKATLHSIAPPFGVAVAKTGQALLLNENSNAMALVDTQSMSVIGGFPVGDAPGTPVLAAGKLFVPEVANLAVQDKPLNPRPAKPVNLGFIVTSGAAAVGGKVYANSGSAVRVVSPLLDAATGSLILRTGGTGGIGSALEIAGANDGRSLLASYVVLQIDGGPIDAGLIRLDTLTRQQKQVHSLPFVPNAIAANDAGTAAFGIGFYLPSQVGLWDLVNNVFVKSVVIPGNPDYVALAPGRDGKKLYLVDQKGKLDILDAGSLALLGSLPLGVGPSAIAISADGTRALVTDAGANSAVVVDLAGPAVVGSVNLGAPSSGAVFLN